MNHLDFQALGSITVVDGGGINRGTRCRRLRFIFLYASPAMLLDSSSYFSSRTTAPEEHETGETRSWLLQCLCVFRAMFVFFLFPRLETTLTIPVCLSRCVFFSYLRNTYQTRGSALDPPACRRWGRLYFFQICLYYFNFVCFPSLCKAKRQLARHVPFRFRRIGCRYSMTRQLGFYSFWS